MITNTVKRRLLKGIGANAYGQLVNAGTQLAGVPILLHFWGAKTYGEWLVLIAIPSYLTMTDIGFTISAANDMTTLVAAKKLENALAVFQSVFALIVVTSSCLFCLVSLVLYLVPNSILQDITPTPPDLSRIVLFVLSLAIICKLFDGLNQAGFRANGEYFIYGFIYSTVALAQQLGVWIAAALGLKLGAASLAVSTVAFVCFIIVSRFLVYRHRWVSYGFRRANFGEIRRLALPAVGNLSIPLAQALSNQGMVIIVGISLGPVSVVTFAALRTIARVVYQLLIGISNAAEPEFASSISETDSEQHLQILFGQIMSASFWLAVPTIIFLNEFGGDILRFWTHGRIKMNTALFVCFLLISLSQMMWNGALSMLRALNQHVAVAGFQALTSMLSLTLSFILLQNTHALSLAGFSLLLGDLLFMQFVVREACQKTDISLKMLVALTVDPRQVARFFKNVS